MELANCTIVVANREKNKYLEKLKEEDKRKAKSFKNKKKTIETFDRFSFKFV